MEKILPEFQINLTTWIYLSSLLTISIYFKFNRLWSLRNLDLIALLLLAPGLLLASKTGELAHLQLVGYWWLFVVGAFLMARMLIDPTMVRRPLLEPNLNSGGLTFIGVSMLVFLTVNVLIKTPTAADLADPQKMRAVLSGTATPEEASAILSKHGPGYPGFHALTNITMAPLIAPDPTGSEKIDADNAGNYDAWLSRVMLILSHLAVVAGILFIGARHYDNIRTGVAAATLYLLLPYTADKTGSVDHILPAALMVWAVVTYRRPAIAGIFLGLAAGVIYYPVFLLPLWIGFYWQRGLLRFLAGFAGILAVLVSTLALYARNFDEFWMLITSMSGWTSLEIDGAQGVWSIGTLAPYRIPVMVTFAVMSIGFALWPAQKNLGTLISCSAAVMLGTQFWDPDGAGVYMGWYLPLLLLTVFRPNLEDRVAIAALGEGWFSRRRSQLRVKAA